MTAAPRPPLFERAFITEKDFPGTPMPTVDEGLRRIVRYGRDQLEPIGDSKVSWRRDRALHACAQLGIRAAAYDGQTAVLPEELREAFDYNNVPGAHAGDEALAAAHRVHEFAAGWARTGVFPAEIVAAELEAGRQEAAHRSSGVAV